MMSAATVKVALQEAQPKVNAFLNKFNKKK